MSITVTATEVDVACGAGASVDGISPAKAVPENAQASATANMKRFIFLFSPLDLRMQDSLQEYRIEQIRNFLQGAPTGTNILRRKQQFLHSRQEGLSGEDSLTKTTHRTPDT